MPQPNTPPPSYDEAILQTNIDEKNSEIKRHQKTKATLNEALQQLLKQNTTHQTTKHQPENEHQPAKSFLQQHVNSPLLPITHSQFSPTIKSDNSNPEEIKGLKAQIKSIDETINTLHKQRDELEKEKNQLERRRNNSAFFPTSEATTPTYTDQNRPIKTLS